MEKNKTLFVVVVVILCFTFLVNSYIKAFGKRQIEMDKQQTEKYAKQAMQDFDERMELIKERAELYDIIYILEKELINKYGMTYDEIKEIKKNRVQEKKHIYYKNY